jgi:predicted DNA-binding transcriptional regulator YafY
MGGVKMLENLLERISRGGSFSIQSLAAELDVSIEMLESMLADLVRVGRIRYLEHCENTGCKGCQMANFCKPEAKIWMVVEH